jgi:hypothetical protein
MLNSWIAKDDGQSAFRKNNGGNPAFLVNNL